MWDGRQQLLRIGVGGLPTDCVGWTLLDDFSLAHDRHLVRKMLHDLHVVVHEKKGQAKCLAKFQQQLQNRSLA